MELWDRIAAWWERRWREDDVQCKECGCTAWNACVTENEDEETCWWVRDDLCSACASPQERDQALREFIDLLGAPD